MSEGRFRSALNGFNRQDVAAYIEGLSARVKAAQQERDQLSAKCAGLEAQVGELQHSGASQSDTVALLQRQVQESDAALQQAAQELSETKQRLSEADAELDSLRSKLQALETVSAEKAEAAKQLAELREEDPETVAAYTTANAIRVYGMNE